MNSFLCGRCGRWYTPEKLIDNDLLCANCIRMEIDRNNIKSTKIYSKVKNVYNQIVVDEYYESCVYFLYGRKTKLVKIGYSTNFWKRFYDIKVSCPDLLEVLGVVNAPIEFENELHNLMKPYHSHGEWYELPNGLKQFVKEYGYIPKG